MVISFISRRGVLRLATGMAAILVATTARSLLAQTPKIHNFDLAIRQRRIAKNMQTLRVNQGERVVIHWVSDEAVEVHLHGYDIELNLQPETTVTMDFIATVAGRYPISGHGFDHHALVYLEVQPR